MRDRTLWRGQGSYVFELVVNPSRHVVVRHDLVDRHRSLASLGLAHLKRAVDRPRRHLDIERIDAQGMSTQLLVCTR